MVKKIFKRKSLWAYFCAFTIFISLGALQAADLYLFIVADYDASELLPALSYDVKNIRNEAKLIAKHTGLKVKEVLRTGSTARTRQVLAGLRALKPTKNDVVLVYFTGHGFRTPSKGNDPWPNIAFQTEEKAIDVSDIQDIITAKAQRLSIIMVDCCNNVLPDNAIPLVKGLAKAVSPSQQVKDNYRKLFLEARGEITIAACKANETSLALSKGSLYTLAFLNTLHQAVQSPLIDWQGLLDAVNLETIAWAEEFNEVQEPVFLILP